MKDHDMTLLSAFALIMFVYVLFISIDIYIRLANCQCQ